MKAIANAEDLWQYKGRLSLIVEQRLLAFTWRLNIVREVKNKLSDETLHY